MADLTPEQRAQLFQRLGIGTVGQGIAPALDQAAEFKRRVLDPVAPAVQAAGALAPGGGIQAAGALASQVTPDMAERARSLGDSSLVGLNDRVRKELAKTPQLELQDTPLASVTPARPLIEPLTLKAPQVGAGMGGGGGLYGELSRLQGALANSDKDVIDTMMERPKLMGDLGAAQEQKTRTVADLNLGEARRQKMLGEWEGQIDQESAAKANAFLAKTQDMSDKIAQLKPDLGRYMRSKDLATKVTFGLGAVAGGMLQAINGGSNDFLDRLQAHMKQDVDAQVEEFNNKKFAVSSRQSLFAQMMQQGVGEKAARMGTYKLLLDAAATKIRALSDLAGIPEAQAQVALVQNQLEKEGKVAQNEATRAAVEFIRKQIVAQVQAAEAAKEREWRHKMEEAQLRQGDRKLDIEEAKVTQEKGKADKEQHAAQTEVDANMAYLQDAMKRAGEITKGTAIGNLYSKGPSVLPGVTGERMKAAEREAYNVRAKMIVGAIYKLDTNATEPKNIKMVEELSAPFTIPPDAKEEEAKFRMAKLARELGSAGAAKGAVSGAPLSFEPYRKLAEAASAEPKRSP